MTTEYNARGDGNCFFRALIGACCTGGVPLSRLSPLMSPEEEYALDRFQSPDHLPLLISAMRRGLASHLQLGENHGVQAVRDAIALYKQTDLVFHDAGREVRLGDRSKVEEAYQEVIVKMLNTDSPRSVPAVAPEVAVNLLKDTIELVILMRGQKPRLPRIQLVQQDAGVGHYKWCGPPQNTSGLCARNIDEGRDHADTSRDYEIARQLQEELQLEGGSRSGAAARKPRARGQSRASRRRTRGRTRPAATRARGRK